MVVGRLHSIKLTRYDGGPHNGKVSGPPIELLMGILCIRLKGDLMADDQGRVWVWKEKSGIKKHRADDLEERNGEVLNAV